MHWDVRELGNAMRNAVLQHADPRWTKERNNKILCNGFWRGGDKQNVCIWPDTATWKDIKTAEGGGCKKFAEHAFNLSLPEFMERYGNSFLHQPKKFKESPNDNEIPSESLDTIWKNIVKDNYYSSRAADSFLEARGFINPRSCIGSGYADLKIEYCDFFSSSHAAFLRDRAGQGKHLLVPIRDIASDMVSNLFVRSLAPQRSDQKSRLLPHMGGWHDNEKNPRAFGFPHLIHEFNHLLLFEGMADYFAGEYLINHDHNFLPIGVPSASFFPKWAELLANKKYKGNVTIIYQLDRQNGKLSIDAVGTKFGAEALKILRNHGCKAFAFDWPCFLEKIYHQVDMHYIGDIADICRSQTSHNVEFSLLSNAFLEVLYAGR